MQLVKNDILASCGHLTPIQHLFSPAVTTTIHIASTTAISTTSFSFNTSSITYIATFAAVAKSDNNTTRSTTVTATTSISLQITSSVIISSTALAATSATNTNDISPIATTPATLSYTAVTASTASTPILTPVLLLILLLLKHKYSTAGNTLIVLTCRDNF